MAVNLPASRLRRPPRVRRDPIDISPIISLVAVEAAEAAESTGASLDDSSDAASSDAGEILAALEARQAAQQRCVADPHVVWATDASAPAPRRHSGGPGSGISVEQVRVWMDQVEADLRKVRARVEYLTAEQARLDEQQRIMAQLLTTSSPV